MRSTHPDLATDESDRASRETASKWLGEAHAILTNPVSRQRYDNEVQRAERTRIKNSSSQNQNSTDKEVPNSETKPATSSSAASPKRRGHNGSQSVIEADDLRDYDSLSIWLRYVLWRSAINNKEWRQVRNTMLAQREYRFKVPIAWFGAKGKTKLPVQPLVRWHPILGAAISAALASFIAWWFDAAPLYAKYIPAIAAYFPEIGVGFTVSFIIVAAILGAFWTAIFWPTIRKFRNIKRRFCIRVVLVLFAILNAPLIAIAILLAGFASMLFSAFSRRS